MPEHVIRIADQAAMLGGPSAGLLIITAAWTGCRWGELAGLQRDHVHLDHGTITIDPDVGALHESAHGLWLGPPKTPALARTITLPPFLVELLHDPWRLFRVRSCSPALSAAGCAEALSTDACSGPPSKPAPVSAHCPLRHSSRGRARAVVRSARTRCPTASDGAPVMVLVSVTSSPAVRASATRPGIPSRAGSGGSGESPPAGLDAPVYWPMGSMRMTAPVYGALSMRFGEIAMPTWVILPELLL
jgi:hypothetical protein